MSPSDRDKANIAAELASARHPERTGAVPGFLVRSTSPQKVAICRANGVPVYCSCADCGEPEAIMHGAAVDAENCVGSIKLSSGLYAMAYWCRRCFAIRVEAGG